MSLVLPVTLTNGTTANAPDVMSDLNAIVNYINNTMNPQFIPAGTEALFLQAAAPTGWTQDAATNDVVLRLVSGVGAGTGGTWDNSTGLSITGTAATHTHTFATPSHDHTGPSHQHTFTTPGHQHATPLASNAGLGGIANYPFGTSSLTISEFPFSVGSSSPLHAMLAAQTIENDLGGTTAAAGTGVTGATQDDAGGTTAASGTLALTAAASSDSSWRPSYKNVIACTKN